MSTRPARPPLDATPEVADRLHVLPHARPPIDPGTQPLVGNESVDDNLAESARVAMWNAIGAADRTVTLTVEDGMVTLSGTLPSADQSRRLEAAVAAVPGITRVNNFVQISTAIRQPHGRAPQRRRGPEPFAFVTRFCGLDEASTTAAIRQAVADLDALFSANGVPRSAELIVVFRNRLPNAVTLDIGMPLPPALVGRLGEGYRMGYISAGPLAQAMPEPGLAGALAAGERLVARAYPGRRDPFPGFWQRFAAPQFRPWQGHVPAPVFISLAAESGEAAHT